MHVLQVFTSSLISKNLREKWFCIHEDMPDRVSEWLTVDEDELEPMFVYKDPNSEVVGKEAANMRGSYETTFTYLSICIYIYIHKYVYIYIYIYTHTPFCIHPYTHTHSLSLSLPACFIHIYIYICIMYMMYMTECAYTARVACFRHKHRV